MSLATRAHPNPLSLSPHSPPPALPPPLSLCSADARGLIALATAFLARQFEGVAELPSFPALPPAALADVLAHEGLVVRSETRLLQILIRWALARLLLASTGGLLALASLEGSAGGAAGRAGLGAPAVPSAASVLAGGNALECELAAAAAA
jgi:hypothetical protein